MDKDLTPVLVIGVISVVACLVVWFVQFLMGVKTSADATLKWSKEKNCYVDKSGKRYKLETKLISLD